ncbi:hypothetical protein TeGR_g8928, partial [Tetraparma gracilis]
MPDNYLELIFAWLLCVFQVSFYAYILGTLFSYVVKKDDNAEQFRKSMTAIDSYCQNRSLPPDLTNSLKAYLHYQLKRNKQNNNQAVVAKLPNTLLGKVATFKFSGVVMRSEIFKSVPHEFVNSFLEVLSTRYLMPNE